MAQWANTDSIESYEDAVQAVLEGIGMRVDPRKVLWCNYPIFSLEHDELLEKVRKDTSKLEKEVEHDLCPTHLYYVGIPKFKLTRRGIPHISCEVDLYYAASAAIPNTEPVSYWCWFGKIIPKVDEFVCPLCLISPLVDALSRGQMETQEAHIVERTQSYSTYHFMEREWKVPDAFLGFVWALMESGKGLEGLLDPYSCLLMNKLIKELPSPEVPKLVGNDDYEAIVFCLKEQMGYPKAKAEEAAKYVSEKSPQETLENKIKQALNYLSG